MTTFALDLVNNAAADRAAANEAVGAVDVRVSGRTRSAPDIVGVSAELALRAFIPAATFPGLTAGKDEGWDARLSNGKTVDVKGSATHEAHLLVPKHQLPVENDYLLLALFDRERDAFGRTRAYQATLVGWIAGVEFMQLAAHECRVCGRKPRSGVWVHHSELHPMGTWPE